MQIKNIRIGQNVRHPKYDGTGDVTKIEPKSVEVFFNHGKITLDENECQELIPLDSIDTRYIEVKSIIQSALKEALRAESPVTMAKKWTHGKLVMKPASPESQDKEIELETFFHKIVMIRDNLRVLEQKINSHKVLTEIEKVELQQYITRMAGSLTTFNVLFKDKEDQI